MTGEYRLELMGWHTECHGLLMAGLVKMPAKPKPSVLEEEPDPPADDISVGQQT